MTTDDRSNLNAVFIAILFICVLVIAVGAGGDIASLQRRVGHLEQQITKGDK